MTALGAQVSALRIVEQLNLRQKHQAHIPEMHPVYFHQCVADDGVSEVPLPSAVAPSVVQLVKQIVSTQLVGFHGTVEPAESSHIRRTALGHLVSDL